ncbi:hypothetical protein [Algiphilus sp.]|uniref:hypothetical protein n=1 Tax=Algiphilus sp. TaxID=1872431 RepID=UPI0025C73B8D|nr:hypothetical protein [Algiphilus sp.]MCK5770412.1 hypothetical protein [Algiphilus sp.]
MRKLSPAIVLPVLLLVAAPAAAYVGPGLGAGTIGVILGFIGSILLALFAIVWFPMKRVLKKRRGADRAQAKQHQSPDRDDEAVEPDERAAP